MLDLVLRSAAATVLIGIAVRLTLRQRGRPAGLAAAMLCCALVAYLAAPVLVAPDRHTALSFVILTLAIGNPPLIWLVARGLFRERAGIGRFQVFAAAAGVTVGLAFAYELPRRLLGEGRLVELAGRVLPHSVALLFIVLAIIDAQREVHSDLVEPRRRLRRAFVTVISAYAGVVSVVEVALRGERAPEALELAHLGLLTAVAVAAAVLVFKRGDSLFGGPAAPRHEPIAPGHEPVDPLLAELERWIARQGFLEPELTVARLARTLGTQEYKLRRLLNGRLGFRNFNDFLHRHRIRVACERLTQSRPELSILELSLDVGYRSLATFNRAFKELTGVSPTEYRVRHGGSRTL